MSNEASRKAFEAWHSQRAAEIISKGKLIAQSMIEAGCTDSGPTHHNALLTALEQADGTGWDAWEASRKALEAEITRLQTLIQKAQSESELIEYKGKAAIVVPYSFMRAATEMPEQAQAVEPVAWITPDGEGFRIRFSAPTQDVPLGWDALFTHPASPPAQPVAVPAGIPHSGADEMPPIFGRRWRLARDGFGLQRDDESGNYVHIDDAISTMHTMLAAAPQLPQGDTL